MINNQSSKGFVTFIILINIFFISYFSVHIFSRFIEGNDITENVNVTDINIIKIDEKAVKIEWRTDKQDANELIYSTEDENVCTTITNLDANCFLKRTNKYALNHELILDNLDIGKKYYFFIRTSEGILFPKTEPYTFDFN